MASKPIVSTIRSYLTALLLCVIFLTFTMKLWKADLHVPFNYGLDALFYSAIIKGTIEHGWYLQNDSLGAPSGLRMHDFPIPDAFNFLLIKLLALIRPDYAWVMNVFFLLSFPLTTLCSLFAFQQFRISQVGSIVWSLLYTFLPFHFFPGMAHLFVATYYVVPLAATVALWISSGEFLATSQDQPPRVNLRSRKFVISIIACLLVSSVGFGYYAFFSCFFILVGSVIAVISYRSIRFLLPALILVAIISGGLLVNLAPNLVYLYRHGNIHVAQRGPHDAEVHGLKIAPMLLPIRYHRVHWLANLTERYSAPAPSPASEMSSLGFIGSIGFLVLLGWLLFFKDAAPNLIIAGTRGTLNRLSLMNVAGVLLATVGGFSSIFALLVSPQIRSYHRISVYLAFFCLLALALILERHVRKLGTSFPVGAGYGVLAVILILGVLDQTSERFVPAYAQNQAEFTSDDVFVSNIERRLPAGALVFQLPYVQFPESAAVNLLTDYELFRGYLHSRNLRWSYGAMKGREGDAWLQNTTTKPVPDMLEAIVFAGFYGIYIDRLGYQDGGAAIENQLHAILQQPPLLSDNQRLAFFDLTEFSARVRKNYSPADWAQKRELVIHPLIMSWVRGCWDREGTDENNWNWCSNRGELNITNLSPRPRKIEIQMALFSGYKDPASIRIQGPEFSDTLVINSEGRDYSRIFVVPPGTSSVSFYCEGKRVFAPQDGRALVFTVANFRWKEI